MEYRDMPLGGVESGGEARFVVRTHMNVQSCRALAKACRSWYIWLLWGLCALLAVCSGLLWWLGSSLALAYSALTAVLIAVNVFRTHINGWVTFRSLKGRIQMVENAFDDSGMTSVNELGISRLGYASFVKLVETDRYFCLFIQQRQGFVLAKAAFERGSADDFRTFIQEKTGLTMKTVK